MVSQYVKKSIIKICFKECGNIFVKINLLEPFMIIIGNKEVEER